MVAGVVQSTTPAKFLLPHTEATCLASRGRVELVCAVTRGKVLAMSQLRILVADDHTVVREGLVRLLSDQQDMRVVAEVENGDQALVAARATSPHVVLLDMRMPGVGGVATIRKLRETCPRTQVLVLSIYDDPYRRRAAFAAGAHGYLSKCATAAEIVLALRSLQFGHKLC